MSRVLHFLFALFLSFSALSMEIKGTIELNDDWQPLVYLASINAPGNLFVASPDFIVAESLIKPDGTFTIEIASVPDDKRFYRLYMVKGNILSVEFNASNNRNYQHLLLDKNSVVKINAKIENNRFVVENVEGSESSKLILDFDKEFIQKKINLSSNLSKAKRDFIKLDTENFIKDFVKTVPNSLVALYAIYHLDEKDTDFLSNSSFYFDFQERLLTEHPNSFYAEAYSGLLESLVDFRDFVCEMPGVQPKWKDNLLIAQAIVIFILVVVLVFFYVSTRKKLIQFKNTNNQSQNSFSSLTIKQQEILKLLANGKTNKEIALELFIELSTVKTHINSIYKQLHLANRKEAVEYYNGLNV